jgi:hypothetical protein
LLYSVETMVTQSTLDHDREPASTEEPRNELQRDMLAGGLLLVLGVMTLGTAIYFLALRPPILPEDARFTGVAAEAVPPRMAEWLSIVFHTWGGFMAGFALLLLGIAGYWMTLRSAFLRWGTALAVLVAFGRFLASNIVLRSDFLPFIVALAVLALVAALRLARRR